MIKDLYNLIKFIKLQKNFRRVFFFENKFIENHLEPYLRKNRNIKQTAIISFYNIENKDLEKIKIFKVNSYFFLNIFFMLLKIRYCYSSTPDLDNTAFRKSIFKKTKYIYIQHSPLGLNQIYTDNAFCNFDIVQVINIFQENNLKEINEIKKKKIRLWRSKYLFFEINNKYQKFKISKKNRILIAPTWGTSFFDDKIHILIKKNIDLSKNEIFIRPHLMSILKKNITNKELISENFNISTGKLNFNEFDILITDWSGIYIEFAKINKIKSILIQNNKKILNHNYKKFKSVSIDIFAREKLGSLIKINDINNINYFVDSLIGNKKNNLEDIELFFKSYFY